MTPIEEPKRSSGRPKGAKTRSDIKEAAREGRIRSAGRPKGSSHKLIGSALLARFQTGDGKRDTINFADEIRRQYDIFCAIAEETKNPQDYQRCFDALMEISKYVVVKDTQLQEIDVTSNGESLGVAYNFIAAQNPAFTDVKPD